MNRTKQELYCHNCDNHVQFYIDEDRDGAHVLNCPECDHEHCRIIENGKITDARWDSRNGGWRGTLSGQLYTQTYSATAISTSAGSTSTITSYTASGTTSASGTGGYYY